MSDVDDVLSPGAWTRPLIVLPPVLGSPPMPSPKKLLSTYDPDEFEEFVKEWIPALGEAYTAVERHGGTGDHGIDVAGYLSPDRLEGDWHNYQCKRYSSAVTWSVAAQEMRKMFVAAAAGHFTVPTRYVFVAPLIARSLQRQLAKPTESRSKFLQELDTATEKFVTDLTAEGLAQVRELAASSDFSVFECVDIDDMLTLHRTTLHYAERFPHAPVDQGPQVLIPPEQHSELEARYVEQLLEVYRERFPGKVNGLEQVPEVAEADAHLKRQREAFYTAEALRVFARDSTMPGYFEKLMEDVYDIVVEVADQTHPDGWERLAAVTFAAGSVQLTPTVFTQFVEPRARKGVCHHLANEDRLVWCRRAEP